MTETERTPTSTPLNAQDTQCALKSAWRAQLGGSPERHSRLIVCAQIWHETAGGRSCWNYNLAGVKHVPGDGRDFAMLHTFEVIDGRAVNMRAAFRAFDTLDAGMSDYFQTLRTTFASVWPALAAGDIAGYAHALKLARYYTAAEADYLAGLTRHYHDLDAQLPPDTMPETPAALAVLPDPGHGTPPDDAA